MAASIDNDSAERYMCALSPLRIIVNFRNRDNVVVTRVKDHNGASYLIDKFDWRDARQERSLAWNILFEYVHVLAKALDQVDIRACATQPLRRSIRAQSVRAEVAAEL